MLIRYLAVRNLAGCLAIAVALSPSACRSVSRTGNARLEGYKLLAEADAPGAVSAFTRAALLATTPEEKARALIGAGRAAIACGDPREALRHFYDAQKTCSQEPSASEANRGLGEAYLSAGDYSLARRYLTKGLPRAGGDVRQETLARLVVCARGLGDTEAATAYRSELEQPFSDPVRMILENEGHSLLVRPDGTATEPVEEAPRGGRVPGESWGVPPRTPDGGGRRPPAPGSDARISVIPRTGWSARAPRGNIDPMGQVEKITVHHSGGDSFWGMSRADAAAEIRSIQRYHQSEQGWADIGYHYIVDREGNIWQGRRLRYQGAHARGSANYGNIGIVLLGNYLHQGITPAQRSGLELLVAKLCRHFTIPAQSVYTHREIVQGKTDCPGPALTRCVHQIRENLRRRLVAFGD